MIQGGPVHMPKVNAGCQQLSLTRACPVVTGSQGGLKVQEGRAELARPLEAFAVLPQSLDQSKSQVQPSFTKVEKENLPTDEKSNKSHCKGYRRIYGYFHNLQ